MKSTVIMDWQAITVDFGSVMSSRIGFLFTVLIRMRLHCFCSEPGHIQIYFNNRKGKAILWKKF